MAFENVVYEGAQTGGSEAMNFVSLRQVIDDFIITMDSDDYISNVSDVAIRNIALRGIREFGFDVTNRVRSIKRSIDSTNNTIQLPDDFVGIVKLGVVDSDGIPHLPKIGYALNCYFVETYWSYPKAVFHPHNSFIVCQ